MPASRHSAHVVQRPAAHAHEADVQSRTQREAVAASARDQLVLDALKLKKACSSNWVELAQDLTLAQVFRFLVAFFPPARRPVG